LEEQTSETGSETAIGEIMPFTLSEVARKNAASRRKSAESLPENHIEHRELLSRIGKRYRNCDLDNYRIDGSLDGEAQDAQAKALESVRRFVDSLDQQVEDGNSLLLFGTVGTGKDHLMAAAAMAASAQGRTVIWANTADIFQAAKATWGQSGKSVDDILRPLQRCDVLALSDPIPPIGDIDPHEMRWLLAMVDARYRACRSTWLTMNVDSGKTARQKIGNQVVDRLRHGATVIEMRWDSYRRS
jgi:DNA replication protein DnaC